jgi:hypothetical protein
MTLERRETAKDCHHQFAVRRCGVTPGIAQAAEACTGLGDSVERVEQISS